MGAPVVIERAEQVAASLPGLGQTGHLTEGVLTFSDGSRHALAHDLLVLIEDVLRSLEQGKVVHVEADTALVSPDRARELLGVSRPTIYAWQDRGLLGRVDRGNRRMVPVADLVRYKAEAELRTAYAASLAGRPEPSDERVSEAAATFADLVDPARTATSPRPDRPRRSRTR